MKNVLLQQLNNSDFQWLKTHGDRQQIPAQTVLVEQHHPVNNFYIILQGVLVATMAKNQNRMDRVFAALEEDQELMQEITRFEPGEMFGEISFSETSPSITTVKSLDNVLVLVLPAKQLRDKLEQDIGFAARFYRASAILLLDRFNYLVQLFLTDKIGQIPPLQDVPLIFGELSDSDVDWMISSGQLEELKAGEIIISAGRPVENLYFITQGTISVLVSEERKNPLSSIFAALENDQETQELLQREIAQMAKGNLVGELAILDTHLSFLTYVALENCTVLKIPRQKFLLKLEQDVGMAARFYRVVLMLLSQRLQNLSSRLGYGRTEYKVGQSLSEDRVYEDEIDVASMDNLTLGGARLDWMLKRLKLKAN